MADPPRKRCRRFDVYEKIDYLHNNPVRRQLVAAAEAWPWSSCHAWETGIPVPIAIDRQSLPVLMPTDLPQRDA
jgi:hypothetical protein